MKARERDERGDEKKRGNWSYNKKKSEQRLGGKKGGLSLEAFSRVKSMPSGFNPSIIKKQREFYKNAKLVSKYKKSQKHGSHHTDRLTTQIHKEVENEETKPKHNKKRRQTLESLKEESERKREEKVRERLEREAMIKARNEEREKAEGKRKVLKENMFKKTRSGQPVMKYRIEHILDRLLESKNK
ncbi:hypothetical protein LUZ60_015598 [Juncus effusus]|nr:hypothetical protein LUZ60_015598 [Juncus effusus]